MTRLVIVDTSVLVAGLITHTPKSPTLRIVDAMLKGELLFLLDEALLSEYRSVLNRPNIHKRHQLTEAQLDTVLTDIVANSIWVEGATASEHSAPDPDDNHLWALHALKPKALLVTGDRLLLDAPRSYGVVVTPSDFCSLMMK